MVGGEERVLGMSVRRVKGACGGWKRDVDEYT